MFKKKNKTVSTEKIEINTAVYTADYILSKALDIGENILRCGGESHRIEDTIERICSAYGAVHTDVFALPSLVVAGIRMADGTTASQVRRVYKTSNNMYKLDEMNSISRDVCSGKISLEDVEEKIHNALHNKPFPKYLSIAASEIRLLQTCNNAVCVKEGSVLCRLIITTSAPSETGFFGPFFEPSSFFSKPRCAPCAASTITGIP